jgi:hypothetical protein
VLAAKIGLVQQIMILVTAGATFFQLFSPVPTIGCNPLILNWQNWDQEDAVLEVGCSKTRAWQLGAAQMLSSYS